MTYKIGTRVRVVWAKRTSLVGLEGVVSETVGPLRDQGTGEVRLGYGLDTSPIEWAGDHWVAFSYDQLNPIIPEGHAPGIKGTCEPLDKLLSEVRERESAMGNLQ